MVLRCADFMTVVISRSIGIDIQGFPFISILLLYLVIHNVKIESHLEMLDGWLSATTRYPMLEVKCVCFTN